MSTMTNHTENDIWTTSASADEFAHDQEIDLGDGWHALAYPFANGVNWGWELWDQWLHTDEYGETGLRENGIESSEDAAKSAALAAAAVYGRSPR